MKLDLEGEIMVAVAQSFTILPVSKFNQSFVKTVKGKRKAKKILMIEDDSEMSSVISKALKENYGCTIDVAHDPFEAINFIVDKFYDLIILDWQLPGLNGAETLVAAEKGLRFEPSIPIQWDRCRAPVVIFSSSKKSECPPRRTKHFNYTGFISKGQPLTQIIDLFGAHLTSDEQLQSSTGVYTNPLVKLNA